MNARLVMDAQHVIRFLRLVTRIFAPFERRLLGRECMILHHFCTSLSRVVSESKAVGSVYEAYLSSRPRRVF